MAYFSQIALDASPKESWGKKIRSITLQIRVKDCSGVFYITDVLFQGGSLATGWVAHPTELRWTQDG